jgi:hypothetical protein
MENLRADNFAKGHDIDDADNDIRLKTVFGAPVLKLGAYPQIREGYGANAPYKWQ